MLFINPPEVIKLFEFQTTSFVTELICLPTSKFLYKAFVLKLTVPNFSVKKDFPKSIFGAIYSYLEFVFSLKFSYADAEILKKISSFS